MESNERAEFVKRAVHRDRIIWGLFLVALGVVLLLDRVGPWRMPGLGQLWPVILIVFALVRLFEGRPGSALTLAGLGFWFLAVEFTWYGLNWLNSWPLALVAVGLGIVVRALTGEDRRRLCCPGVDRDLD
jgi:hypothetical protein